MVDVEIRRGGDRGLEIRRAGDRGLEIRRGGVRCRRDVALRRSLRSSAAGSQTSPATGPDAAGRHTREAGSRIAAAQAGGRARADRSLGASRDVDGCRRGALGCRRRFRWPNPSRAIWIESRQRRPAAAPVRTGAAAPRRRQGPASLGQGVEGRRQGRRRTLAACSGAIGLGRRQVWGRMVIFVGPTGQ